jgi:hypothetical protein
LAQKVERNREQWVCIQHTLSRSLVQSRLTP